MIGTYISINAELKIGPRTNLSQHLTLKIHVNTILCATKAITDNSEI